MLQALETGFVPITQADPESQGKGLAGRPGASVHPVPPAAGLARGGVLAFFAILGIVTLSPAFNGIAKTLRPCPEPKATISERTLIILKKV